MRFLVCDSLYCPEAFFCSHLSSYSHYLAEYGEEVLRCYINEPPDERAKFGITGWVDADAVNAYGQQDVAFVLDRYDWGASISAKVRIAQVAAICNPMPWDVRKPDGSPAYDLILSSLRWMVEEARAKGCRAEYMPLAFDLRARTAIMHATRTVKLGFIGTLGPNHQRRTQLVREMEASGELVVFPPLFGRDYFRALASCWGVFNPHAEWARGELNNMRMYEASGVGTKVYGEGTRINGERRRQMDGNAALASHTYEHRIPHLVSLARELLEAKR